MVSRGIYVRDTETGELLKEVKMSGLEVFSQISNREIFIGLKFNKYYIIKLDTLEVKKEISAKDLNINDSLSFSIRKVFYKDKDLCIEGFEQYKYNNYNKEEVATTFERKVPVI